jgi:aryl-alcohol dehydrogenase-like predicted oxidoreductase
MQPTMSGLLTGKYRRGQTPKDTRLTQGGERGPPINYERLYKVLDALDKVAEETGKSLAQVSLNWLLQRLTVANIVIGARNEEQLKPNFGALEWNLTTDQVKKLDVASNIDPVSLTGTQRGFLQLNTETKLH